MSFCEHILARQVDIYDEFCDTYTHIYRERVAKFMRLPRATIVNPPEKLQGASLDAQRAGVLSTVTNDEDSEMID